MAVYDKIFGQLNFDYGWSRDLQIDFLGKNITTTLRIDGEEDEEFEEGKAIA